MSKGVTFADDFGRMVRGAGLILLPVTPPEALPAPLQLTDTSLPQ